jgi:hypothetical protein
MNTNTQPRRRRQVTGVAVLIAFALAACSPTAPSPVPTTAIGTASLPPTVAPTATPTVAPTGPPTPAPTIRLLSAADLGEGWTIIATESNVSGIGRIGILGPIKIGTSYAFVCVGVGTARVSFAAASGMLTPPPDGANEFYSAVYTCPTEAHEFLTNQFDDGGISLNPDVAPSAGVTYDLVAGTQR